MDVIYLNEQSSNFVPIAPSSSEESTESSSLPVDMIPFIETVVGKKQFVDELKRKVPLPFTLALLVMLPIGPIGIVVFVPLAVIYVRHIKRNLSFPLAVNISHPFVEQDLVGQAKVMIRLDDGSWFEPGDIRVRFLRDELIGGYQLVEDEGEYASLGYLGSFNEKFVSRACTIINQALALRDGMNEKEDPIVDAREREGMETGLLERSWLEEEEGIEIETRLTQFFKKNE